MPDAQQLLVGEFTIYFVKQTCGKGGNGAMWRHDRVADGFGEWRRMRLASLKDNDVPRAG